MRTFSFLIYSSCFLMIALTSCQSGNDSSTTKDPMAVEGEQLSRKYCGACHLPVAPDALDKETWSKHVLPAMGPKLGLEIWQTIHYYYPPTAAILQVDWIKLLNYHEKFAPEKPSKARPPVKLTNDWAMFRRVKQAEVKTEISTTTMVAFNSIRHQIYTSNESNAGLYQWNSFLKPTRIRSLPSPAVQISFMNDATGSQRALLTCIGTMLAVDKPAGELLDISLDKASNASPRVLSSQLPRPIQSTPGDFNKDGLTDWLVCGYGHEAGTLYWLKQRPDHQFDKLIIKEIAGATQVITGDFNHDNRLDIVYTCGDNSDYSRILKPFHGVYIFTNQGNYRYKQTYFYPINGCTKVIAKDGDLDLATIAFFGDLKNNPAETFIYFEQHTATNFTPYAIPMSPYGRWICMDANDWDQYGDGDIVLGNYSLGFLNEVQFTPAWNG